MRVRPITREDHPAVVAICTKAFEHDELWVHLYPNMDKYPDDLRRSQAIRFRMRLVSAGQLGFVVETEPGDPDWSGKPEVVGYAYFLRWGKDEAAKKWQTDSLFWKFERMLLKTEAWYESTFLDRAMDKKRLAHHIADAPWDYFTLMGSQWHLAIIAISPDHQRRGVGSMLVQHGQKIAAEEGLPITLEGSVKGRGAYLKNGFKIVHEVPVTETFSDCLMAWEPVGMEGKWLEGINGDRAKLKEIFKSGKYRA